MGFIFSTRTVLLANAWFKWVLFVFKDLYLGFSLQEIK